MKTIKYYAKNVYGNRTMYLIDEKMKLALLLFNGHTTITGQDMKAFNQLGFFFEEVMEPKSDYKSILSANISEEIDTDHGVLRAFWKTGADLIKQGAPKSECLKFLQEFSRQFGNFKMVEMKGDMIDAGIFTK